MALRAVPDHPKFAELKRLLDAPKHVALGALEAIWHFAGRFTPQGNIGKYPDSTIEAWVEWSGEPGALIEALVSSHWLDRDSIHRILVHDWPQHADKATKQALTRAKQEFCTPTPPTVRELKAQIEHGVHTVGTQNSVLSALPVPVPVPEPVPVPVPEPEPVAPAPRNQPPKNTRRPVAIDKAPVISDRFEEWWLVWSAVRGTASRIQASQAWLSIVRRDWEADVFACTSSYLTSSLVADGGGFNPQNFLFQQSQDAFRARWPPKQSPAMQQQSKSKIDWDKV